MERLGICRHLAALRRTHPEPYQSGGDLSPNQAMNRTDEEESTGCSANGRPDERGLDPANTQTRCLCERCAKGDRRSGLMRRVVEFPLLSGGTIGVEVTGPPPIDGAIAGSLGGRIA